MSQTARIRFRDIRSRLTVWNILLFGGILVLYAVGTFAFLLLTLNRQFDEGLKEDLEFVQQLLGRAPLETVLSNEHGQAVSRLERFLEIWSADGQLLYRSRLLGSRSLGAAPSPDDSGDGLKIRSTILSDGSRWRVATVAQTLGSGRVVVRLGVSEAEFFSDLRNYATVLLVGIPLGLLLVVFSGYVMAWAALRPIDTMASTARRIGAQNLRDRIPVKNPDDELGRLASAFNDLLARVENAFEQLRRFTADASHELRTPLTSMRSVGEVSLQGEHTSVEYREVIGSMLEESGRLAKIVDSLLFLSRADAGKIEIRRERIDLMELAKETAGLIAVLAEDKKQTLAVIGDRPVIVQGDPGLLRQALLNLVDNAIKYSPPGSTIDVCVGMDGNRTASLEVRDNGPGIPAADLTRIFERFSRADRTHTHHGAGLGLAIARWAVEANNGMIAVRSAEGGGSTFVIRLPLAQAGKLGPQSSAASA